MKLISSYPRSGSSWFRFIICNLYYPNQKHDFISVNDLFPGIDTDKPHIGSPKWGKTHELKEVDLFLFRHVGDVLISLYHYNRKFDKDFSMSFREFLFETDFGKEWREHVNYYKDHPNKLRYTHIDKVEFIVNITNGQFSDLEVETAITKSHFTVMQKAEEKGFGVYPSGDLSIKFCREGRDAQWTELENGLRFMIEQKNEKELQMLGFNAKEPEENLITKTMSEYYKNIPGEMCDFRPYYDKIANQLKDNCKVVEVGVADGHSAIYLAEKLESLGKNFHLIMVDSMDYGGEEQYQTVFENIIKSGFQDSITLYKMDSLKACCKIVDGSQDFVFIDASHEYLPTLGDGRLWYHKVQPRKGILAGHDMTNPEHPGVAQAINEVFKPEFIKVIETEKEYGVWEVERFPGNYQLSEFA